MVQSSRFRADGFCLTILAVTVPMSNQRTFVCDLYGVRNADAAPVVQSDFMVM